jgi:hypothetical protein
MVGKKEQSINLLGVISERERARTSWAARKSIYRFKFKLKFFKVYRLVHEMVFVIALLDQHRHE